MVSLVAKQQQGPGNLMITLDLLEKTEMDQSAQIDALAKERCQIVKRAILSGTTSLQTSCKAQKMVYSPQDVQQLG